MERKDVDLPADAPKAFLRQQHIDYIEQWNKRKGEFEYVMSEYLRMSGLYWCVTALELLDSRDKLDTAAVLKFIDECFDDASGGFSASQGHDPHLLYTLSAVQILCIYDAMQQKYVDGACKFIAALQREDGSFQGDEWGEVDTRFSFCALAALSLLGKLDAINVDAAVQHVLRCLNFDGGFGVGTESESHAGQIYCCVGVLTIANRLYSIDQTKLGLWLSQRQLERSGGFNGRPEKLPDVCYSWWVLSSIQMLQCQDWIDADRLKAFILACQDDESGGFADRPGDMVDPFHTLFGIAALSMLGESDIDRVNCVYCMPHRVIQRLGLA
ncbi:rabggtb protein [Salpingoeca rosetta]|uniref:Geranylgeranyl transferase type-2 subunit beta n=1 Tax=Salpingoeca rosetta (strain ATCC 50818 / BSB-021) TaxID=946362 RepID=F2U489_SALR5|nr:rabggtb protein [Salpingoeca rosetta]EGD82455.1 rabggtb protein [Salpingoeca rosetta]|eukprot:XP_004995691.1 rabggtb protein [Salpingoeca rosetta]